MVRQEIKPRPRCYRPSPQDDRLVPGVVPVRGWPPAGSGDLPAGQRYFADEDPANLPQSDEMLRRLRSTCS